jgi:hypothetical protein
MAWFKVDDKLHSSRKLLKIPRRYRLACLGLWTMAGSWSADQGTDGLVPAHMIEEWGASPMVVQWLVTSNLWVVEPETDDSHFQFKNWDEYQPTSKELEHRRERNREKLRHWRERNRVTGEDVTGLQDGTNQNVTPPPTRPVPTRPLKDSSTDEEFDRWYAGYPRKEAKTNARKAFAKARKSADMDILMASLEKYVASVKGKERQYIALPASWLNAGRWEDEYAPASKESLVHPSYAWANQ